MISMRRKGNACFPVSYDICTLNKGAFTLYTFLVDRHSEMSETMHVLTGANSTVVRRSGSQFRPRDAPIPISAIAGRPDEAPSMMMNSHSVWKLEMHQPDIQLP